MQGNIYWVGSAYECSHDLRGFNDSVVEQPFQTRTCLIGTGHSNAIRPVYGVCVPRSCQADDLVQLINRQSIRIPWVNQILRLTDEQVHCIDPRPVDSPAVLTM